MSEIKVNAGSGVASIIESGLADLPPLTRIPAYAGTGAMADAINQLDDTLSQAEAAYLNLVQLTRDVLQRSYAQMSSVDQNIAGSY